MSSLILAIGLAGVLASDPKPTNASDPIQRWVDLADSLHPEARSARDELLAAQEDIRASRAWMPPNSQFLYKTDGTRELSLTQMIPAFGKTGSLEQVANRRVEMVRADSGERLRKLGLAVREAAWMEWMAWAKIKIFAEQESLSVRLAASSRRLQAQGMATASEAWLAEAKVRQTRIEADRARAEATSATAMRQSWTGPGERSEAGPPRAPDWNDSALSQASRTRTDIQTMNRDASMQEAMGQAMRNGLRPDFMVGGMVMQMPNGMPGWGVMAGMTLPFVPWARGMQEGSAGGALARSRAIQGKAQTMERMARAEVADHAAKAHAAWNALLEIDSLLPAQERAVADAGSRYAQGREMLTMVLQMEDMATMTRMEAVMRRGEYELERARLYAAAALPMSSSSNRAIKPVADQTTMSTDGTR